MIYFVNIIMLKIAQQKVKLMHEKLTVLLLNLYH